MSEGTFSHVAAHISIHMCVRACVCVCLYICIFYVFYNKYVYFFHNECADSSEPQ